MVFPWQLGVAEKLLFLGHTAPISLSLQEASPQFAVTIRVLSKHVLTQGNQVSRPGEQEMDLCEKGKLLLENFQ